MSVEIDLPPTMDEAGTESPAPTQPDAVDGQPPVPPKNEDGKPKDPDPKYFDEGNPGYIRMKNAEKAEKEAKAENKKYKEQFGDLKPESSPAPSGDNQSPASDPINLAKTVNALREYSAEELDHLQVLATGMEITPAEASKSDAFKTFVMAHREKVVKDNATPAPSSGADSVIDKTPEEIGNMSDQEFAKYEKDKLSQKDSKGV